MQSDNPSDSDKNRYIDNNSNHDENYSRESISSPGFDDNTSNSTLSAASPDPAYGSSYNSNRSQRISTTTLTSNFSRVSSVESWAERHHSPSAATAPNLKPKPRLTPKIEGHLAKLSSDVNGDQDERNANIEIPKVNISSRRELFEKEQKAQFNRSIEVKKPIVLSDGTEKTASIKERLSHLEKRDGDDAAVKEVAATNNKSNRVSGDFSSARERFVNSEQFVNVEVKPPKIDVPVVPLKERLLTLESSKPSEILPNNSQLDNRTKKMNEPKMIDLNEFDERMKLNTADNDIQEENLVIVSHKHQQQKEDNDSGINSDDLQSSLASQQSQTHQINDDEQPLNDSASPTKQHAGTVGRKPEVLPRRQITPDLVKTITPKVNNIEDDLLQSQDEIDDEADNSVSPSKINSPVLTKNIVNLTIKSILVDSNDICKASNTITTTTSTLSTSSSSSTLVMDNKNSIEHTGTVVDEPDAKSIEIEHNVDNNNRKIIRDNCNPNVDVEQKSLTSEPSIVDLVQVSSFTQNIEKIEINESKPPVNVSVEQKSAKIATSELKLPLNTNFNTDLDEPQSPRESIQSKNERIKCQIVGVLEKNKLQTADTNDCKQSPTLDLPHAISTSSSSSSSPAKSPSKTKNIFDYIKRNLLNETTPSTEQQETILTVTKTAAYDQDTSKFYISLNETENKSPAVSNTVEHQKSEINLLPVDELKK